MVTTSSKQKLTDCSQARATVQKKQSGGFLEVTVQPPSSGAPAIAEFAFFNEQGTLLFRIDKLAAGELGR